MVSSGNCVCFCKSDVSAVQTSKSSKVNNIGTNRKHVCDFLLVRNSNLGPILHRLRIHFIIAGVSSSWFNMKFVIITCTLVYSGSLGRSGQFDNHLRNLLNVRMRMNVCLHKEYEVRTNTSPASFSWKWFVQH